MDIIRQEKKYFDKKIAPGFPCSVIENKFGYSCCSFAIILYDPSSENNGLINRECFKRNPIGTVRSYIKQVISQGILLTEKDYRLSQLAFYELIPNNIKSNAHLYISSPVNTNFDIRMYILLLLIETLKEEYLLIEF